MNMSSNQKYLNLLRDLVALPSVSAIHRCLPEAAQLLTTTFRELGAQVTYDDTYFAPFVLAQFRSSVPDAQTLVIYNHYDVQPVEPISLWQTDPWTLSEHDGKLYGRGTDDDKGNILPA